MELVHVLRVDILLVWNGYSKPSSKVPWRLYIGQTQCLISCKRVRSSCSRLLGDICSHGKVYFYLIRLTTCCALQLVYIPNGCHLCHFKWRPMEEVYVKQPPSFEISGQEVMAEESRIWLETSSQGLIWQDQSFFISFGFEQISAGNTLYVLS